MASPTPDQGLMPSILDRLLDPDSAGTEWRHGYGLDKLLDVVRRDLEDLLNTRQTVTALPRDLVRLRRSIHAYGLPDLTSFNPTTPQERQQIAEVLERTLGLYEPRLRDIRATLLATEDQNKQRTLHFRIDARIGVDPAPEVAFDTVLKLTTGEHSVNPTAT
jgi:type VI secretion system protein ImpF